MLVRYYPPEPSGGARRPFLMARELRALGHRVTVVSPFADHDDDIRVPHPVVLRRETAGWHPENDRSSPTRVNQPMTRLRNWAREWLLWPDPEIRWARRASKHITALDLSPDWFMTSNPPESLHVVAPLIKDRLRCHWIAEFRDTWTFAPHRHVLARSGMRRAVERIMARRALRHVDAVSSVSEAVMGEMRNYLPAETHELILSHFSDAPPPPASLPESDLNIVHSGGFELSDRRRKLSVALEALDAAASARPDRSIHLHIAGALSDAERDWLNCRGQNAPVRVTHHGVVPLQRSRALQAGADALLLHTPEDSHALPGKFSEYRQAGRPILYLGGGDWLSLVDAPDAITPLRDGMATLEKGQFVPNGQPPPLDATAAARRLSDFLTGVSARQSIAAHDG